MSFKDEKLFEPKNITKRWCNKFSMIVRTVQVDDKRTQKRHPEFISGSNIFELYFLGDAETSSA